MYRSGPETLNPEAYFLTLQTLNPKSLSPKPRRLNAMEFRKRSFPEGAASTFPVTGAVLDFFLGSCWWKFCITCALVVEATWSLEMASQNYHTVLLISLPGTAPIARETGSGLNSLLRRARPLRSLITNAKLGQPTSLCMCKNEYRFKHMLAHLCGGACMRPHLTHLHFHVHVCMFVWKLFMHESPPGP